MGEEEIYQFRCTVKGHDKDIRAVTASFDPDEGFITGSRDGSVRVWRPDISSTNGFDDIYVAWEHEGYFSSLCALPPSEQYPRGLILAGCTNCAIYGYTLESSEPVLKLLGHSDNVCALTAGNLGTFASGSWDRTARIWNGQRCVSILSGHREAVWAVAFLSDNTLMLTGSADKTICLWRNETCERKYTGHEDCVRGLAVISDFEFISCSNDATIRRWETSGRCIGVYDGHSDYIYDIRLSNCREYYMTCSEDQTVRVWKENFCTQVLKLPARSLWAVAFLKNGDIAVGCSDKTVKVFTKHKDLRASYAEEDNYWQEVSTNFHKDDQQNIEEEVKNLPGIEALKQDGTSDGQTRMCRIGDEVFIYQWSVDKQEWLPIGTLLQDYKKKTQEYDYEFTVDAGRDGTLKLGYNKGENPYVAAQRFIDENDLSPLFLEQIVQHILSNTNQAGGQLQSDPLVSDPFTGTSRYVPSDTGSSNPLIASAGDNSRLVLQKDSATGNNENCSTLEAYFTLQSYITFSNANVDGLKLKLTEFSQQVESAHRLSTEEIASLLLIIDFPKEVTDFQMLALQKALSWPEELIFPALDVLRLSVRAECVNSRVVKDAGVGLINLLLTLLPDLHLVANQVLVLKTLTNFFIHQAGEQLLREQAAKILNVTTDSVYSTNKHVQIALSSLYVNYSVALQNATTSEDYDNKNLYMKHSVRMLKTFNEVEAIYRLFVCLGILIQDKKCLQYAKEEKVIDEVRVLVASSQVPKILDFGNALIKLLMQTV